MDIAIREATRLDNIITEFLQYARPPALNLAEHDLNKVLAETLDLVQHEARTRSKMKIVTSLATGALVALVDQDKLGLGVTVFVSIETDDHSQGWLDHFAEVVGAMPEVMEFYRMAGDVDYMLRVVVPDIQGYDTFYKQLIASVPLKNVTSRFAMEKIKATTALPIP